MADEQPIGTKDDGTPVVAITPLESAYIRYAAYLIAPLVAWLVQALKIPQAIGVYLDANLVQLLSGLYVLGVGYLVARKRIKQGQDPANPAPPIAAPKIVQRLTK